MIRYIKHKDIDKTKWDNAIEAMPNGTLYAYSWWLDIVSPNWNALIDDDYNMLMPLPTKSKYGIKYMLQPSFTQQLGIYSYNIIDKDTVEKFVAAIPKNIKKIILYINFDGFIDNKNYRQTLRNYQELDLNKPYAILRKEYHASLMKGLKKAEKFHLQMTTNVNADNVISFMKEIIDSKKLKISDTEILTYKKLIEKVSSLKLTDFYGLMNEKNELISASCMITVHGSTYCFSWTSPNGRETRAHLLLRDKIIEIKSGQPLIYNFCGSDIPGVKFVNEDYNAQNKQYLCIEKKLFGLF